MKTAKTEKAEAEAEAECRSGVQERSAGAAVGSKQ